MRYWEEEINPLCPSADYLVLKHKVSVPSMFPGLEFIIQPNVIFIIQDVGDGYYILRKKNKGGIDANWIVNKKELEQDFKGIRKKK